MHKRLNANARSALALLVLTAALMACRAPATPLNATPTPAESTKTTLPAANPGHVISTDTPASPAAISPSPTSGEAEAKSPTSTAPILPVATPTNPPAHVSNLPDPAGVSLTRVIEDLKYPVFVTGAGDDSGALYIVQQSGQIRVAIQGQINEPPFLEISDRTSPAARPGYYGERGLLGLAFHPQYSQNGYFYVNYTDRDGNTVISRFQRKSDNPYQADPASETRLLQVTQPYPNHNGGMLAFGPDGYLYIGLGDGGSGGDPLNNAQSTQTMLGKLLRIDVNQGSLYANPADNPYAAGGGLAEIWAIGLRNPWRFSFDRLTGDLYIADVGQNQWEEINFLPSGSPGAANFGWRFREGAHAYQDELPSGLALVEPVAEYGHGPGCSVTGGVTVRSPRLPDWQGVYLYGDYCSGQVWGLLRLPDGSWQNRQFFETGMNITSFGLDDAGEVYVIDYNRGDIYRLDPG